MAVLCVIWSIYVFSVPVAFSKPVLKMETRAVSLLKAIPYFEYSGNIDSVLAGIAI
jgi:hypothetical protein